MRHGYDLGLVIIAEGVETQQQADVINRAGCDLAQGFPFAHPMTAGEIEALLSRPGEAGRHLLPAG